MVSQEVERYEVFEGKAIRQMPPLLSGKNSRGRVVGVPRVPGAFYQIMQERLPGAEDREYFLNNYFDVSDLTAYASEARGGDMKFVLTVDNQGRLTEKGREVLSLIKPRAKIVDNGEIYLGDERYEFLKGEGVIALARKKLSVIERPLTKREAYNSELLRILLRHQDFVPAGFEVPGLHKEAIDNIFKEGERFGYEKMMGVYPSYAGESSKLGAWYVCWLENRSDADGRSYLDYDYGRFVGFLAPEA